MKKKITKPNAGGKRRPRSRVRKQSKSSGSSAAPLIIGGVCVAAILLIVMMAGKGSSPQNTAPDNNVANVSDSSTTEFVESSKKQVPTNTKTAAADEAKPEVVTKQFKAGEPVVSEVSDKRKFMQFQLSVRQLAIEKKWNEAYAKIDSYEGPYLSEVAELRQEVKTSQKKFENFVYTAGNNDQTKPVGNEVAKVDQESNKQEPTKLKPLGDQKSDRGPNGFLYMTEREKTKTVKAPSVTIVVHSEMVGLPDDKIVVWKDRDLVLSYSRLIKNCENKESKYYKDRVQKAKDFLEEHKGKYALVPLDSSKMTLRRNGFTVSEVFFNEATTSDEGYGNKSSKTDRYKGYIISYDIRQKKSAGGSLGFGGGGRSMGC